MEIQSPLLQARRTIPSRYSRRKTKLRVRFNDPIVLFVSGAIAFFVSNVTQTLCLYLYASLHYVLT